MFPAKPSETPRLYVLFAPNANLLYNITMSLITLLIIVESIVAVGLLIWLIRKAYHHVKQSPAEKALKEHLAELESIKAAKKKLSK